MQLQLNRNATLGIGLSLITGTSFILLSFLMATIVLSTIITQSSKQVFFKSENRPTAVIANASLIHKVPGIEIHTTNSFPSGHTATAFSLFLFCCFISAKKWIVTVGFAYALIGGYARIYAAQHFPIDVGAGILVAYCSILLSWVIHINYFNK